MKVSLIITTFNRPVALMRVLQTIRRQTRLPHEVIVADDGSSEEIRSLLDQWSKRLPLVHIWIPDCGFRAARVRNIAILKATGDYVVMVDGDCLLPPAFIENHVRLSKPNKLVAGSRYMYGPEETENIETKFDSLSDQIFGNTKFRSLPFGLLRDLYGRQWDLVRTCNVAMYRAAAIAVYGLDERYIGWGREDSDFVIRLLNNGMLIRNGRFSVCVGHLFHKQESRDSLAANEGRFQQVLTSKERENFPVKSVLMEL